MWILLIRTAVSGSDGKCSLNDSFISLLTDSASVCVGARVAGIERPKQKRIYSDVHGDWDTRRWCEACFMLVCLHSDPMITHTHTQRRADGHSSCEMYSFCDTFSVTLWTFPQENKLRENGGRGEGHYILTIILHKQPFIFLYLLHQILNT